MPLASTLLDIDLCCSLPLCMMVIVHETSVYVKYREWQSHVSVDIIIVQELSDHLERIPSLSRDSEPEASVYGESGRIL